MFSTSLDSLEKLEMNGDNPQEFLLQELQLMEAEIQRLRAEGIARLNFLFTITSALFGGVLVIVGLGRLTDEQIIVGVFIASFILFVISLSTFEYALSRDVLCDKNARGTGRIRKYFLLKYKEIENHVTWQTDDAPTHWITSNRSDIRRVALFFTSTLAGIAGGSFVFWIFPSLAIALVAFIFILIITGLILIVWAEQRFKNACEKANREQKFV